MWVNTNVQLRGQGVCPGHTNSWFGFETKLAIDYLPVDFLHRVCRLGWAHQSGSMKRYSGMPVSVTCRRNPAQHRLTPSTAWTTYIWAVAFPDPGAIYTGKRRRGQRGPECRGVTPAALEWTAQREEHAVIGAAEGSPEPRPANACSLSGKQQLSNKCFSLVC